MPIYLSMIKECTFQDLIPWNGKFIDFEDKMTKAKITLDNMEKSLLINLIVSGADSEKFTDEEKEILRELKKRLQEM